MARHDFGFLAWRCHQSESQRAVRHLKTSRRSCLRNRLPNDLLSDQTWQVDLGGQTQTRLRIASENMANVERGRSRLRQSDTAEISCRRIAAPQ